MKTKYVAPIGKISFRIHFMSSFIAQCIFILCIFLIMKFSGGQLIELGFFSHMLILTVLNVVILKYFYSFDVYRARFKDIYPDQNLSVSLFLFLGFIPLAFLCFSFFLCLKESADFVTEKRKFRKLLPVSAGITLIVIQSLSPVISYWSSSPSLYFIVDTSHGALDLIELKESAIYKDNYDVSKQFLLKTKNLNSTKIILSDAVNASVIMKESKRSIASGNNNDELKIKYLIHLLNTCYSSLSLSNSREIKFSDHSLIQWLHPSGPIEIYLLNMIEQQLLVKFYNTLTEQSLTILERVDKKSHLLNLSDKDHYLKEIADLKFKFNNLRKI